MHENRHFLSYRKHRHDAENRRFPEITGKDNLTVFSYSGRVEAAAEKSRSATVLDLQAWTYYNLY